MILLENTKVSYPLWDTDESSLVWPAACSLKRLRYPARYSILSQFNKSQLGNQFLCNFYYRPIETFKIVLCLILILINLSFWSSLYSCSSLRSHSTTPVLLFSSSSSSTPRVSSSLSSYGISTFMQLRLQKLRCCHATRNNF